MMASAECSIQSSPFESTFTVPVDWVKSTHLESGEKLGLASSEQFRSSAPGGQGDAIGANPVPSGATRNMRQGALGGQRVNAIRRPSGDQDGRSSTTPGCGLVSFRILPSVPIVNRPAQDSSELK